MDLTARLLCLGLFCGRKAEEFEALSRKAIECSESNALLGDLANDAENTAENGGLTCAVSEGDFLKGSIRADLCDI